tara:strand:+ start:320 stop:514 length:195 start_codon:yes stop_codon:yes gene_type:complete
VGCYVALDKRHGMDNTNRVVKICIRIKEIDNLLDYTPLYDGEVWDLTEEKIELEKELELLPVAT